MQDFVKWMGYAHVVVGVTWGLAVPVLFIGNSTPFAYVLGSTRVLTISGCLANRTAPGPGGYSGLPATQLIQRVACQSDHSTKGASSQWILNRNGG